MIKEFLFGKKVRAILSKTDKILKKLVTAPVKDLKDVYKITADSLVTLVIGISKEVFTPENIEAAMKAYLMYKAQGNDGVGFSVTKKF